MPTMNLTQTMVMGLIQVVAVLILIFVMVPLLTFAERKVLGFAQDRLGATRIAGHRIGEQLAQRSEIEREAGQSDMFGAAATPVVNGDDWGAVLGGEEIG